MPDIPDQCAKSAKPDTLDFTFRVLTRDADARIVVRMERYEITLDATTNDAAAELAALANDANATFANIHVTTPDSHRFAANDVTLAFDAEPADYARYAAYYDMPDDDA